MTARTMAPIIQSIAMQMAPSPAELRAAMQACAFRLADTAPTLETVADVHGFVAHLEGMRRYAQLLAQALERQAAE